MSVLFLIMLFIVVYVTPINKDIMLVFCLLTVVINAIALILQLQNQRKINNNELLLFYFVSLRSGNFALHHTI